MKHYSLNPKGKEKKKTPGRVVAGGGSNFSDYGVWRVGVSLSGEKGEGGIRADQSSTGEET